MKAFCANNSHKRNLVMVLLLCSTTFAFSFDRQYTAYAMLLSKYVCNGGVAYQLLQEDPIIGKVQNDFSSLTKGNYEALSHDAKIAYLVNCYNFYTIALIVKHYPLKSIRDIKDPWGEKNIPLAGDTVSLDYIENVLLRKQFAEPRIHFALVCASKSCPVLSEVPFYPDSLDEQLTRAAKKFLQDTHKNTFDKEEAHISMIFNWYGGDFKNKYGDYKEFIRSIIPVSKGSSFTFNSYDWALNDGPGCR